MDRTRSLFFLIIFLTALIMLGAYLFQQMGGGADEVVEAPSETVSEVSDIAATVEPSATPEPTATSELTNTAEPESTAIEEVEPTPESTPTIAVEPINTIEDALDYVRDNSLVVGVNVVPPFVVQNGDGYEGFDIDILNEMLGRWDAAPIEYKQISASERISCVAAGECDLVISAITQNVPRCTEQGAICSNVYFKDGARLLVRSDSGIKGTADLDGKIVGVVNGTTAVSNVNDLENLHQYESNPRPKEYATRDEAIQAVEQGIVSAYTTDGMILTRFESDTLEVVGDEFTAEPYVIVMNENHDGLKQLVNETLGGMKLDGSYDSMFNGLMECRVKPFPITTPDVYPDYLSAADGDVEPYVCDSDVEDDVEVAADGSTTYTIQSGETLGGIATREYGDFDMFPCIQTVNNIEDVRKVQTGATLTIPSFDECKTLLGQ